MNWIVSPRNFSTYFKSYSHATTKSPLPHSVHGLTTKLYTDLLQAAIRTGCLMDGKVIHAHLVITCFKSCRFLLNNLLNMYCKCGDVVSAHHLFDRMRERNVTSWNCLISGYSQMGLYETAMGLFVRVWKSEIKLDKFSFACGLGACAEAQSLMLGKTVHGMIVVCGYWPMAFLANSLIGMYSKCGRIGDAKLIFERADDLDNVSWNSLISAYNRTSGGKETLEILVKMHRKGWKMDTFALGSTLKACASFCITDGFGKMLHGYIVKVGLDKDIVISGALLDMYAKTGSVEEALHVFKVVPERNIIMYNSMIAAFCRPTDESICNMAHEAFELFCDIQKRGMRPSNFTYSIILQACNTQETIEQVKQIHALIFKNNFTSDRYVASSLVDLYAKMGSIEDAWKCFDAASIKDIVCWTSMMAGCVQHGQFMLALNLFYEYLTMGKKADEHTISSALSACAGLAAIKTGRQVQAYELKYGVDQSTIVCNSQICLAEHGWANEALRVFRDMEELRIIPNEVTFLSVLTACSHGNLVDEALRYYERMKRIYGIDPNVKHSTCMVDILGRAGKLVDAELFILNSKFKDDPVMWRSLLGACKIHRNVNMGRSVAERVIELEPNASASYVLLYNMYLDNGDEQSAMKVRNMMKDRQITKEPGISWPN